MMINYYILCELGFDDDYIFTFGLMECPVMDRGEGVVRNCNIHLYFKKNRNCHNFCKLFL